MDGDQLYKVGNWWLLATWIVKECADESAHYYSMLKISSIRDPSGKKLWNKLLVAIANGITT